MKKIIFSTLIASLLAFVGCQNEELVNDNSTDHGNGKKVTLTAHIQGSADSRVALTPATDENSKPIVMVDWRNSDKKEFFKVACVSSEGLSAPTTFTQVEGSQFTGTIPSIPSDITPYGFYATYGGTMDESGWNYNLSRQYGTLNEEFVLMEAKMVGATLPTTIDFEHITAILQPTFTGVEKGEIVQIVMSGVQNEISPTNNATGKIMITPTDAQNGIYVFLTMPDNNNYYGTYISNHTFTFTVTAGGKLYTGSLTIPTGMSIVAGNLYTATIALTEVNACYLPKGTDFNSAITDILNGADVTAIEFVANLNDDEMDDATSFSDNNMPLNAKYKIIDANGTNPKTLKICTDAEVFMFNADCSKMFLGREGPNFTKLASIVSIDFNNCVNTSNVQSMEKMFSNCKALTSLDLSNFDPSNVTTMKDMFQSCGELETLYLSNFVTSKLTNMNQMFYGCSSLTLLKLSSFDTSKVTDMKSMFNGCSSLASLNLSNFNTSNVTTMSNMFSSCSSLTSLDLSNFDTSNVTNMYDMFSNCKKLETLDLRSFTLGEIVNIGGMFYNVGSEFTSGKTQIYVATPNPFEGKSTSINTEYAVYVPDTP